MAQLTCRCQNCPTEIQFEDTQTGEVVPCPACGLQTTLYDNDEAASAAASPPPLATAPLTLADVAHPPTEASNRTGAGIITHIALGVFVVASLLSVGLGIVGLADAKSAIQETGAAVFLMGGFILGALTLILDKIVTIMKQ